MSYINAGVDGYKTKKALKDAVKANPASVYAYGTSALGPQFSGPVTEIPEGAKLSIAGPDPYNDRKWYATIERDAKTGMIKVS